MTDHFKRYWLPVVVWGIVIFAVSSFSRFPESVQPLFSLDEIAHAIEYAVFSFLLARALKNSKKQNLSSKFRIIAVIIAILYGITDEFHQSFVPMRTPSVIDLFYDGLGAVIGQFFYKKS